MEPTPVLFVIESLGRGGAERQLVTIVSHIDRRRFRPILAVLSPPYDFQPDVEAVGVPVHRLGLTGPGGIPRASLRLRQLVRSERIEVVHSHLYFANLVARLGGVGVARLVTTLHNPDYTYEDPGTLRFRIRKLLDWATAHGSRSRFIAVSEEVKRDYERHLELRGIEVLYNFMDVGAFRGELQGIDRAEVRRRLGATPEDLVLLHVGRFHEQKGHDTLLRAFSIARKRIPSMRLLLAGDGRLREAMEDLARDHHLDGSVSFLGKVEAVQELYRAADAFVFPSRFEAFGIALLEALAAGLPAIVTRAGGLEEVANEACARFVEVDDVVALADAMCQVVQSEALRKEMGAAAAERARAFDVGVWMPRLEEALAGA